MAGRVQKYQAIPQYKALNQGMSLDAFKTIFWWEWTHRLLGRVIGVAFLVPLLWFLWRGFIGPGLRGRLWFIFGLGVLQGAVGWWMVASGLAERIEVSQYRLATHLVLACVIYAAMIWTAQRLGERPAMPAPIPPPLAGKGEVGALIRLSDGPIDPGAGANLSRRHRRWPSRRLHLQHLAADRWSLRARRHAAVSHNACVAQFLRKHADGAVQPPLLAYGIFICALLHAFDVTRTVKKGWVLTSANVLALAVTLQAALGIATLLQRVPLSLALAHQAMAMLVLTIATTMPRWSPTAAREDIPLAPGVSAATKRPPAPAQSPVDGSK